MIVTQALRNKAMALLAADTTTLAEALGPKMGLSMANFAPSEQMTIATITPATFTGNAPLACTPGTQPEGLDPAANDSVINLSPPAGGFRWITGDAVSLPQTIYGYYLTNHAGTVILAAAVFATPIILTAAGQVIDLGDARLTLPANSIR